VHGTCGLISSLVFESIPAWLYVSVSPAWLLSLCVCVSVCLLHLCCTSVVFVYLDVFVPRARALTLSLTLSHSLSLRLSVLSCAYVFSLTPTPAPTPYTDVGIHREYEIQYINSITEKKRKEQLAKEHDLKELRAEKERAKEMEQQMDLLSFLSTTNNCAAAVVGEDEDSSDDEERDMDFFDFLRDVSTKKQEKNKRSVLEEPTQLEVVHWCDAFPHIPCALCVCVCVCVCVCALELTGVTFVVCVYVYVYIYIYICMFVYLWCVYLCVHLCRALQAPSPMW
jgi:hypothetical protein